METRDQLVESILRSVRTEISEFVSEEKDIICPIEYEQKVLKIAMNLAKSLVQETQGRMPKSRNVKKSNYPIW